MKAEDYGAGGREGKDIPLVAGSVVTRRWFAVIDGEWLTAPFHTDCIYPPPHTKGRETHYHATCDVAGWVTLVKSLNRGPAWSEVAIVDTDKHQLLAPWCSCGFYSYFSEPAEADLVSDGSSYIGAVVENYGKTVYGSKGIRSEKMRIRALVLGAHQRSFSGYFKYWWGAPGHRMFWLFWLFMIPVGIMTGIGVTINGNEWAASVIAGTVQVFLFLALSLALYSRSFRGLALTKATCKRLKSNYRVPVYNSWKEAERDFPHTKRKDLP